MNDKKKLRDIVHGYDQVKLQIVWKILQRDLETLKSEIAKVLASYELPINQSMFYQKELVRIRHLHFPLSSNGRKLWRNDVSSRRMLQGTQREGVLCSTSSGCPSSTEGVCQPPASAMSASASFGPQLPRG